MPNKSKWKVGDLVRLKSGGPTMTVEGYLADVPEDDNDVRDVRCSWFPENGFAHNSVPASYAARPETADFAEDALEELIK